MANGPALSVDKLSLAFPGSPPLFDGLSFRVAPGERVAIIGRSGIGKTTLLRLLSGVETRHGGRVEVDGKPAADAPVPGMVFQDARLLPWLTAAGNIHAVNPALTDEAIAALLASVGLAGLSGSFPRTLSGGMQRRLGLARAISVNPRLLLLDEPFVSLDRLVVRELQALFLALFEQHRPTVVLVSHDPEDAARLADRAILLADRPVRLAADLELGSDRSTLGIARTVERIEQLTGEVNHAAV